MWQNFVFRWSKIGVLNLLAVSLLFVGCTAQVRSSRPKPDLNLNSFDRFYVVRNESERRGVNQVIDKELQKMGKRTTVGPRSLIPKDVDVIVVYHDEWVWDMGWYLFNLAIQLRDPETNLLLASAISTRPSLARTPPELMVREVLASLFK